MTNQTLCNLVQFIYSLNFCSPSLGGINERTIQTLFSTTYFIGTIEKNAS
jgi:hypothetical protein